MAQFVVDDEQYMNPVPHELRHVAVLVEPLTIAEKALIQVWDVQQRLPWSCPVIPGKARANCHRAVVLGAGPVGLLGAMALVANDFDTYVYAREPVPNPKATVLEMIGAKYRSAETHSLESLAAEVGNIDLVYEATGASPLAFEMVKSWQEWYLHLYGSSRPKRPDRSGYRPHDAQPGSKKPGCFRYRQRRT
jgi:threonine dehydrogenase-like Zn-dependent dehydrogenase